jgi:hypothetical protein
MNRRRTLGLLIAVPLMLTCTDEHETRIDRIADFYVQRLLDTLPADTGTAHYAGLAYNLPTLDSLTASWTVDEWVRFWERVEEKRRSGR